MKPADRKEKIAVVVGTVTNDIRILQVPKLKVNLVVSAALRHDINIPPCRSVQ